MCDMCNDPTLTASDVRGRLAAIIADLGWALQFVEPEGRHPSLVYTIGLTDFAVPELVGYGFTTADAKDLNEIAHDCVHGLLRAGSTVEISGLLYRLVPQPDVSPDAACHRLLWQPGTGSALAGDPVVRSTVTGSTSPRLPATARPTWRCARPRPPP